jgi:hypothetical protein
MLNSYLPPLQGLRMTEVIPSVSLYGFVASTETNSDFILKLQVQSDSLSRT